MPWKGVRERRRALELTVVGFVPSVEWALEGTLSFSNCVEGECAQKLKWGGHQSLSLA